MRSFSALVVLTALAAVPLHGQGSPQTASASPVSAVTKAPRLRGTPTWYYPTAKPDAEGQVVFSAVVDTSGDVDPSSILLISATDPDFVPAARATLLSASFHPAQAGKQRVPMRIEMSICYPMHVPKPCKYPDRVTGMLAHWC